MFCKKCISPRILVPLILVGIGLVYFVPKIGIVILLALSSLLLCGVMCGGMGYMMMKGDKTGNGKAVEVKDSANIIVEHGYTPEVITVPRGKTTELNFIRTDPGVCQEELVMKDFGVKKILPLNQKVTVELIPEHKGEFKYAYWFEMRAVAALRARLKNYQSSSPTQLKLFVENRQKLFQ